MTCPTRNFLPMMTKPLYFAFANPVRFVTDISQHFNDTSSNLVIAALSFGLPSRTMYCRNVSGIPPFEQ
jgi:hypothetical protein